MAGPAQGPALAQVSRPWGVPWSQVAGPLAGAPRIIGGTGAGCLIGAERLADDGPGWQAVRVSRNRPWGHPERVGAVQGLAARATAAGLPARWVG